IYREMVASKNDAYRPRLAYSLYYLAIIREDLQKTSEAESEYLESQSIYAALAAEDPKSFLLNHANLSYLVGEFYLHNGKPAEAEAAYQLAVSEYRILKAEDDSGFEYYQAESFSALGGIYTEQKRFPEAKTAYSQALIAYSEAETQAPGQYQSHMAATLFNLGSNSSSQGQIQGAISAYSESAAMYRKLSSQQPDVYLDDLADALYNLGFNYSAAGKKQEAEQFYREAYDIFRPLAAQNPVFQAKLANNAFNLGLIYLDADKPEAAEETFLTALDIYRQLAVIKPEVYQAEAASALAQLGLVYSAEKKPEAAEKAMLEAFRIYGDLAKDGSALYRAKTAQTASDIGIFYYRQRKTNAAMESFLIELDLWRGLVREYPAGGYEGRLALALNNLGVQYELQKNFPVALNFYEESIKLREKALLQGKTDEQEEWERVYINILQVRDTALAEDDMPIAVAATRIAAESSDHLKDRSPEMKQDATINYNNLAWLALFTGEYDLAERSARRCLEIDPDFYHANARLGYALLLQGKEKPARKAFGELKGRTDMKGRPYRDVLLAQFDVIESNATSSPPGGWDDIRKWVGKW
ncbi:MAG TPA: tetratricopeptide repeat protein, partial [Saprospiraceae bacterium]|nr:tetratricopeptide repeat protein [Saprospiraceae bacterium]